MKAAAQNFSPTAIRSLLIFILFLLLWSLLERATLFQPSSGLFLWYPPIAMGIAVILTFGVRYLPLLFFGPLLHLLWTDTDVSLSSHIIASLLITTCYGSACVILLKWVRISPTFTGLRDVAWFIGVAGIAAPIAYTLISIQFFPSLPVLMDTNFMASRQQMLISAYPVVVVALAERSMLAIVSLTPFFLLYLLPKAHALFKGEDRTELSSPLSPSAHTWIQIGLESLLMLTILMLASVVYNVYSIKIFILCLFPLLWIAMQYGLPRVSINLVTLSTGALFLLSFGREFGIETTNLQMMLFGYAVAGLLLGAAVTERQRAQKSLNRFFSLSPDLFCVIGPDGCFTNLNPAWENILGWTSAELMSKPFLDFVHPDDRRQVQKEIEHLYEGIHSMNLETRYRCKDGTYRLLSWTFPAADYNRKLYVTGRDRTEQQKTETMIKEQQERYRLVVEQTGQLVYDYDIHSGAILWLGAIEKITGDTPEKFQETDITGWEQRIHPDDRAHTLALLKEAMESRTPISNEYRFRHHDGHYISIEDRGILLCTATGQPYRMLGTMSDISERKKADAALQYRIELEQIIMSISTYFITLSGNDIDAGIDYALRILGEFAKVDRSYIFLFQDNDTTMSNTHEWCAKGIEPRIQTLQNMPVAPFSWSIAGRMKQGHTLYVPHVASLPPEAEAEKQQFISSGIQSLVAVPMLLGKSAIGFLGFDSVVSKKLWSNDIIALMRIVGEVFVNALERKRTEQALHDSETRMTAIIESAMDAIITIDDQEKIVVFNAAAERMFACSVEDAIGQPLERFIPERFRQVHHHHVADFSSETHPYTLNSGAFGRRNNGEEFPLEASVSRAALHGKNFFTVILRDITERQRIEQALYENKTFMEKAQEVAHIGSWSSDQLMDGKLTWSPEVYRIFGLSEQEFDGKVHTFFSLIHPDDIPAVQEASRMAFEKDIPYSIDHRIMRKDGSICWVHERADIIRDTEGVPVKMIGIVQDISGRKEAEEALRLSEERFSIAFHASPDAIIITSIADGRFIDVNDSYCRMIEFSREEIIGKTTSELGLHIDVYNRNDQMEALQQHGALHNIESRIRTKSGRILHLLSSAGKITLHGEECVLGVGMDITEQKRIQEELIESEKRFRSIFEQAVVGIMQASLDNSWVEFNQQYCSMLGYTREELMQKIPFTELTLPEEAVIDRAYIQQMKEGTLAGYTREKRYLHKNGTILWAHLSVSVVRDDAGTPKYFSAIVVDITQRKQAEELIKASLHEKEVLLKEVHHRVKNNLQVISSLINLQAGKIKDPTILGIFRESQNRIRSMALIHERLYHSSDLSKVDIIEYTRTLVSYLQRSYGSRSISIEVATTDSPIVLQVDRAIPCGLIINELVSNSLKHAFPGNAGIITVSLCPEEDMVVLCINDNGVGLPVDMDIHSADSLGLQLVLTLTGQLGGTIQLDRREGTQFTIRFPTA